MSNFVICAGGVPETLPPYLIDFNTSNNRISMDAVNDNNSSDPSLHSTFIGILLEE
jgi:hypothetical protein